MPSNAALCRGAWGHYNAAAGAQYRMSQPFEDEANASAPQDRLDSWKEIATYLNRDITTVQRWEKREGMPVHRHLHDKMGSVYAFRTELEAWTRTRYPPTQRPPAPPAPDAPVPAVASSPRRWTLILGVAAVAGALAVGAGVWLRATEFFWRSP